MNAKKDIVLAYSGGLDTSYCIVYLKENGFHVHALHVNTGGFTKEEVQSLEKKAMSLGATSFKSVNNENDYFEKCLRFLIYGNVLRNQTYPLSVSSERVFQAIEVLKHVQELNANYVAHGSTGAGNDQVRFDLVFEMLGNDVHIITPIRDQSLSRDEEISFLRSKGFEWTEHKGAYSINQGLWGTSVGGAETLSSHLPLPEEAWPNNCTKTKPSELSITFEEGLPVALNNKPYAHPVDLIRTLNEIGHAYAIGRDTHVGDTIIGIKGRVGFEAPAALMIIKAHHLLEKHTLSKWQQYWKNQLAEWYGMALHEGRYFDPVMRQIEQFLDSTQSTVSGEVFLTLHPHRFTINGVRSAYDLMQSKFGQYGEQNLAWDGSDVRGFTKILSNPEKIYYTINKDQLPL